jgi:hypothetical protein
VQDLRVGEHRLQVVDRAERKPVEKNRRQIQIIIKFLFQLLVEKIRHRIIEFILQLHFKMFKQKHLFLKGWHPVLWRDSISRPILQSPLPWRHGTVNIASASGTRRPGFESRQGIMFLGNFAVLLYIHT